MHLKTLSIMLHRELHKPRSITASDVINKSITTGSGWEELRILFIQLRGDPDDDGIH
jgi:hypothetical protein